MDGLFEYWLLLLAKALIWVAEIFTDLVFGYTLTGGSKADRRRAQRSNEHCAQIVSVKWKAHYNDLIAHGLRNFLYVHEKYVNPKYILDNANVTLFTMDTENVIFCVTDPGVDVYNMKRFPFVFMAHYSEVQKLVILPKASFIRLGDELGDPKVSVSLVNMTARCGSTLVSAMLDRVPNTRSMSEPWALVALQDNYRRGRINWDETYKLIQTSMRLHCKVEPGSGIERIVIKMTPATSPMFPAFSELFPDFNLIFNTRHPKPSIISMYKVIESHGKALYNKSGLYIKDAFYNWFPLPFSGKGWKMYDDLFTFLRSHGREDVMPLVFAAVYLTYSDYKDIYKHVVLYENLTGDSEEEAKKIFKAMDVPLEYVPQALEALKQDSQKSTFGKREDKLKLTDEMWESMEKVFDMFDCGLRCNMSVEEFKAMFK